MIKELKYFLYAITIIGFIFFILNYYFSDENKKNSYRSTKVFDGKIFKYNKTLQSLESDTENIVEYVENTFNKDKKKYIRLLTNRLNNKENVKSHFISKLSKFDYFLQFSVNFFEFESFNIINELKRDNRIQFANFVDVNKLKEKYMLYI